MTTKIVVTPPRPTQQQQQRRRRQYYVTDITPTRQALHPLRFKIKATKLVMKRPTKQCGLVYDKRCLLHALPKGLNLFTQENPDRLITIWKEICKHDLHKTCCLVESEPVTMNDLLLTHSKAHIKTLYDAYQSIKSNSNGKSMKYMDVYNDTYMVNESFNVACIAAGGLLNLSLNVLQGKVQNGFAIIRPPGHHACTNHVSGFCLINNVAVVSNILLYRKLVKRVAIVDFDVHHGDGTQRIFYNNPNVLYISVHRYDGKFFPRTGSIKETGGDNYRTNVNIPLRKGAGDYEYIHIFRTIITPILGEFNADVLFVSAGFDAALGDPLGGMCVTPNGYAHITRELMKSKNVIMSLEGGYEKDVIAKCSVACIKSLLGTTLLPLTNRKPNQRHFHKTLKNMHTFHGKRWSLSSNKENISDNDDEGISQLFQQLDIK